METVSPSGMLLVFFLLFWVIFLGCLVSIAVMLYTLVHRGDERRQEILSKTCSHTFYITVAMLVIDLVAGIIRNFATGSHLEGINPFVLLSVISILYAVHLKYYKTKLGG